ncbi:hypothetical protein L9F63_028076, partial [Diploptera punctata]
YSTSAGLSPLPDFVTFCRTFSLTLWLSHCSLTMSDFLTCRLNSLTFPTCRLSDFLTCSLSDFLIWSHMSDLEDFDHVFGIHGEEEFDRVYQRIQLEEQENRRNIACRRRTKITEVVLSLRILGNSLPILRKRRHSCMTDSLTFCL